MTYRFVVVILVNTLIDIITVHYNICIWCQIGTERSSWRPGCLMKRNAANAQESKSPTHLQVATMPGTRCPHRARHALPALPSPPRTKSALFLPMMSLLWWETPFLGNLYKWFTSSLHEEVIIIIIKHRYRLPFYLNWLLVATVCCNAVIYWGLWIFTASPDLVHNCLIILSLNSSKVLLFILVFCSVNIKKEALTYVKWLHCIILQCGICMSSISVFEEPVDMPCGHDFCRACWEGWVTVCCDRLGMDLVFLSVSSLSP